MPSRRTEQLGQLIRDELSELMQRSLRDPRLHGVISITRVELTSDLRHARVFVSALGGHDARARAIEALTGAAGFLRHELAGRVRIRYMPDLVFRPDDSLEYGGRIISLLREIQVSSEDAAATEPSPPASDDQPTT